MGKGNGATRAGNSRNPRGLSGNNNGVVDVFRTGRATANPVTARQIINQVRLTSDSSQESEYGGIEYTLYATYKGYQMQASRNADGTYTPLAAYTTESGAHSDTDLHGRLTPERFQEYAATLFAQWENEDNRAARRRR